MIIAIVTTNADLVRSASLLAGTLDVVDASSLAKSMLLAPGGANVSGLVGNGTLSANLFLHASSKVYAGVSIFDAWFGGAAFNVTQLPAATLDLVASKLQSVNLMQVDSSTQITLVLTAHVVFTMVDLEFTEHTSCLLSLDWAGSLVTMGACTAAQGPSWLDYKYPIIGACVLALLSVLVFVYRDWLRNFLCKKRKKPTAAKNVISRGGLLM
jgi:hypothetical protein